MGEPERAAKYVILASSIRAGARALLSVLPPEQLAFERASRLRAVLLAHAEHRGREPRDLAALERELRELVDVGGHLVAACWSEVEGEERAESAAERLRTSVTLARCFVDRRPTSMPPPMPKPTPATR
jgi:hypothetical protein